MKSNLPQFISPRSTDRKVITGFGVLTALSLWGAFALEEYALMAIPVVVIGGFIALLDFKMIFWLMLFTIPFSTELVLPGGVGMTFPDEPLMLVLSGIYIAFVLKPGRMLDSRFLRHPISVLLFVHLVWIFLTSFTAEIKVVSFKFLAAKLWFLLTFYFLLSLILKSKKDYKIFFWLLFIPLAVSVFFVILQHASYGFSFSDVNKAVRPFYRNHVDYACIMVLFIPFCRYALDWYKRWSWRWWTVGAGILLLIVGIQFSYTRAAYVALAGAIGASFIVKLKMVRPTLAIVTALAIAFVVFMWSNNEYLHYNPDFDRTITHSNFSNLLEATIKGQDVSTMERFYRWIAGGHMIGERPVFGFGPGNFPFHYRQYTVNSFETYISDNEENSGIHNYFLTMLVEQGFPGLIIFLLFVFGALIIGENIYHRTADPFYQNIAMTSILVVIIVLMLQLMNDLLESDKVGSFFFMVLSMLVLVDMSNDVTIKETGVDKK